MNCGDDLSGTLGAPVVGSINSYPCHSGVFELDEQVFAFVAPGNGEVAVVLSGGDGNQSVIAISEVGGVCNSQNCLAGGGTAAVFSVNIGQQYFIVVDGSFGFDTTFDIEMTCTLQ